MGGTMTEYQTGEGDPFGEDEVLTGPARYLRPGEELLVYTPGIQIKKFRFDAYLTDTRLFLTDPGEKAAGVTAKEIPRESIIDSYIEHSPAQEPILVLSIRTGEDDVRTMKMTFVHTGKDRVSEAEEWMHLIKHGGPVPGAAAAPAAGITKEPAPPLSPEARALSETMVFPPPPPPQRDIPPAPRQAPARERSASVPPPPTPRPPAKPAGSTTQIQFCYHCGHRIPPVANFCPYCGTRMVTPPGHGGSAVPLAPRAGAPAEPVPEKKEKKGRIWNIFRRKKSEP